MIDVLVIRLRVEYFLFGDRQIRELMLPRHSLTVLVMNGAAVHSMYCLIIAFIPAVNKQRYRVMLSTATMWGQNSTWWFVHD